jgi:hypothetical protein
MFQLDDKGSMRFENEVSNIIRESFHNVSWVISSINFN